MAEKIRLQKTIESKSELEKVVSKTFTTFVEQQDNVDNDTVSELFRLYDKLYLEIPLEGPLSHTYLIEESSKLVDITTEDPSIQPLLDEISDLRQRLLDANEEILELQQEVTDANAKV